MRLPEAVLKVLGLPPEASTAAKGIDALHATVLTATLVGAAGVALLVTRFVMKSPRQSESQLTPRIEASVAREVGISVAILALFLAVWGVGYRQYIALRTPPEGSMIVHVTAKQWMWKFSYDDGRDTNDELVVPVGHPIELVMTSRDVIHSFYVPAFRTKQDVLPGRYVTAWFEATAVGSYDIFCAEYCGTSHSNMHGTVRVVSESDFETWKRASRDGANPLSLVEMGAAVAARRQCTACHAVDGSRNLAPSWAHLYGSWQTTADGRRVLADDDYLRRSIFEPNADHVAGYASLMPSYAGVLDTNETTAILSYIRSLSDEAK